MVQANADIRAFVAEYVRALERHIRVECVILFGSQARGTADPDSDLDLLVVSPDVGKRILHDIDVLRGSLPEHRVGIDTLGCTPDELASADMGSVWAEAKREGVVLYQRQPAPNRAR